MSVAGASLVVAIGLTALACANWLWLRLDPKASASHLPALADVALVALALHALALVATGTTSPAAYGLTIVLACAATAVRRPSSPGNEATARDARVTGAEAGAPRARFVSAEAGTALREAAPRRQPIFAPDGAPALSAVRAERPQPSPSRTTLWSDSARAR